MDPTATLLALLDEFACDEPDRERILDHLRDLTDWISIDGFVPKVTHCAIESDRDGFSATAYRVGADD